MAWTLRLPADLEERLQSFCLSQGAVKQRVVALALGAYLDSQDLASKTWEQIRSEPLLPGVPGLLEAESAVLEEIPEKKCRHGFLLGDGCKYGCFLEETVT